ncbi:hypothetical protein UFOVP451_9 [uncultured Caudovirales phage]|uniref:Uncharacterized protein n=1 Tax=uncultured Caudovirales phage TaxID=2100421 RepID=A0A6J5M6H4_9CAUD|nr:hypothetical protein UFOVP451_9 [uncultured Caudovirales phage]
MARTRSKSAINRDRVLDEGKQKTENKGQLREHRSTRGYFLDLEMQQNERAFTDKVNKQKQKISQSRNASEQHYKNYKETGNKEDYKNAKDENEKTETERLKKHYYQYKNDGANSMSVYEKDRAKYEAAQNRQPAAPARRGGNIIRRAGRGAGAVARGAGAAARALNPMQRLINVVDFFANPMVADAPTTPKKKPKPKNKPDVFTAPESVKNNSLYEKFKNTKNTKG